MAQSIASPSSVISKMAMMKILMRVTQVDEEQQDIINLLREKIQQYGQLKSSKPETRTKYDFDAPIIALNCELAINKEAIGIFGLTMPPPHGVFQKLMKRWCEGEQLGACEPWVRPIDKEAYAEPNNLRLNDLTKMPVIELQLGSFIETGTNTFYEHTIIESSDVSFEHQLMYFSISDLSDRENMYRLILSYEDITHIVVHEQLNQLTQLFILMTTPLRVEKGKFRGQDADNQDSYSWRRVPTVPSLPSSNIGNAKAIKVVLKDRECVHKILSYLVWKHNFCNYVYFARVKIERGAAQCTWKLNQMDFDLQYACHALSCRGFYVHDQVDKTWMEAVARRCQSEPERSAALSALHRLINVLDNNHPVLIKKAFEKIFQSELSSPEEECPPDCKKVRKIILTPTRKLPMPPEIMEENRVLRTFGQEYALRAYFRDDNFKQLSKAAHDSETSLYQDSIYCPMWEGFNICGRHYEFFAWSNSQLNDHGCWMYARDPDGNTAEQLRGQLGDLEDYRCKVRCVATYMARLGQNFTQTTDVLEMPLEEDVVSYEEDITGGRDRSGNPYCFSDGIGRISEMLAHKVDLSMKKTCASAAYQIRFAGSKGVVARDKDLPGERLVIRRSMRKFDSSHRKLEVCKASSPCPLFLNRNVITILSQMGVADSVFYQLQEAALNRSVESLLYEDQAIKRLTKKLKLQIQFKQLSALGIHMTTEPFFRGLSLAVAMTTLSSLGRARIELDHDKARNMIGVLDETGILSEGHIFCQYSPDLNKEGKNLVALEGSVVVTKNPCVHPGDVRKFTAIKNIPKSSKLWLLGDVLVFPQKGSRPHPNQMAGSDLDGDEYFVCWQKDLIFERENFKPMDFPPAKKRILDHDIEKQDIIEFLKTYIMNDRKGMIGNSHLVHADREIDGIFSPKCLSLAKKCAQAVDFQKSGECPTLSLSNDEIVHSYPDFLGKRGKGSYTSNRILGKLWRASQQVKNVVSGEKKSTLDDFRPDDDLVLHKRSCSSKQIYENLMEQALMSFKRYKSTLEGIMTQYGIQSEFEVICGFNVSLQKQFLERQSNFEAQKLAQLRFKNLWKNLRQEFFKEWGGENCIDLSCPSSAVLQKAKAWYKVAYCNQSNSTESTSTGFPMLIGFPWILWDVLLTAKKASDTLRKPTSNPMISKLSRDLEVAVHALGSVDSILDKDNSLMDPLLFNVWKVLYMWAKKVKILGDAEKQLTLNELTKVILFCQQVARETTVTSSIDNHQFADTCLHFLKLCSSHSFPATKGLEAIADVKLQHLTDECLRAYYHVAQTGTIDALVDDHIAEHIKCLGRSGQDMQDGTSENVSKMMRALHMSDAST